MLTYVLFINYVFVPEGRTLVVFCGFSVKLYEQWFCVTRIYKSFPRQRRGTSVVVREFSIARNRRFTDLIRYSPHLGRFKDSQRGVHKDNSLRFGNPSSKGRIGMAVLIALVTRVFANYGSVSCPCVAAYWVVLSWNQANSSWNEKRLETTTKRIHRIDRRTSRRIQRIYRIYRIYRFLVRSLAPSATFVGRNRSTLRRRVDKPAGRCRLPGKHCILGDNSSSFCPTIVCSRLCVCDTKLFVADDIFVGNFSFLRFGLLCAAHFVVLCVLRLGIFSPIRIDLEVVVRQKSGWKSDPDSMQSNRINTVTNWNETRKRNRWKVSCYREHVTPKQWSLLKQKHIRGLLLKSKWEPSRNDPQIRARKKSENRSKTSSRRSPQ